LQKLKHNFSDKNKYNIKKWTNNYSSVIIFPLLHPFSAIFAPPLHHSSALFAPLLHQDRNQGGDFPIYFIALL